MLERARGLLNHPFMYEGGRFDDTLLFPQAGAPTVAPGKRTLTAGLAPRAVGAPAPAAGAGAPVVQAKAAYEDVFSLHLLDAGTAARTSSPLAVAAAGMTGAAESLPHLDTIQRAFGRHDVSAVPAYVAGAATEAAAQLGATAYAAGGSVAFVGPPDLHTAAHEAAHVVQQRGGVQLAGGVGAAGDRYEQHADRVADQVVRGASAEAILDEMAGDGGGAAMATQLSAVQREEAPAPAEPAAPATTAGLPTTVEGWKQALADAAAAGRDALLGLVEQGGQMALDALPDAGAFVIDTLWPSNTGWRFSGMLQAAGFLGVGIGITLACSGNCSLTIMRSGSTVELEIEVAGGAGGSAGEHLGLEGDVGVIPVRGATKVKLETDLSQVAWPTAMLEGLRKLDAKAALAGLFGAGADVWKHTKVEAELAEGLDLTGEGGLGTPAVGEVGVGGSVGVTVGGKVTMNPDGSEVREVTADLNGAISLAAEISPSVRDAIAGLQEDLGGLAPGLDRAIQPIDPDAPALRDGDVLPGPSDSGNSVNGEAAAGLKFRRTISADGTPDVWEGGFTGSASAIVALLGQSVGGGVAAEVLYTMEDFQRICLNARTGLPPSEMQPVGAPTDVSVSGFLECELQDLTACGAFPGLDVGGLPGVADRMDAVKARLDASFKLDLVHVPATPGAELGPIFDEARARAESGKIIEAIMFLIASLPKLAGTPARTVLDVVLDKLELELSTTDEAFADGDTPGFGEIPSGKGQGSVSQAKVYRFSYTSGSPELNPAAIALLLSDLVF